MYLYYIYRHLLIKSFNFNLKIVYSYVFDFADLNFDVGLHDKRKVLKIPFPK